MTRLGNTAARRVAAGLVAAGAVGLFAANAQATPQISAALTAGAAASSFEADGGPRFAAHLGGRFDVLLLRERAGTMAFGPYIEGLTVGFETLELGGGAEWLVPVGDTAFVLSAGVFTKPGERSGSSGAAAGIFWGSRSFNYHSAYAPSAGLFVQGRATAESHFGAPSLLVGAHIDLEYLALPWVLAYQALRR